MESVIRKKEKNGTTIRLICFAIRIASYDIKFHYSTKKIPVRGGEIYSFFFLRIL